MQSSRTPLSRRLSQLVLVAAVFPAALALGSAALKASEERPAQGPIDDSLTAVGQTYAIMCNTCTTSTDFANKAVTTYPRDRSSVAYVYNLSTGIVRGIALEWDLETHSQIGGYEVGTHPGLDTYVRQAGDMYRRNNNSLGFKLIVRADGSVYWKPASGAVVELRAAGYGPRFAGGKSDPAELDDGSVLRGESVPGVNSPIDVRGYSFPSNFGDRYPNYPRTSYDLGFGNPGTVNNFVRDQVRDLPNGGVSGVFNGTYQTHTGAAAPLGLVQGGAQITKQVTSKVAVIIPMKDGGFAIVEYDVATALVTLKEVQDSQGYPLPAGNGNRIQFFASNPIDFPNTSLGRQGLAAWVEWAHRNGIPVTSMTGAGSGGNVRCSSKGPNEIECTILPR